MAAPIWFGLWNVISLIIAENYGLSKRMRFFVVSIMSYLGILAIAKGFKTYNFTDAEWKKYYR